MRIKLVLTRMGDLEGSRLLLLCQDRMIWKARGGTIQLYLRFLLRVGLGAPKWDPRPPRPLHLVGSGLRYLCLAHSNRKRCILQRQ